MASARVPEAVVASSILRLFKLERFLGNFGAGAHLRQTQLHARGKSAIICTAMVLQSPSFQ
eukprot:446793-Amphidinium_carterae.1